MLGSFTYFRFCMQLEITSLILILIFASHIIPRKENQKNFIPHNTTPPCQTLKTISRMPSLTCSHLIFCMNLTSLEQPFGVNASRAP